MTIKTIEKKLKNRQPSTVGKHKFFSVTLPIVKTSEGLSFLFEVRSSHLNTQPGDICFPGGSMEKDETPLECALREMEEEIGIPKSKTKVLGQFDTLYGYAGYTLYSFAVEIPTETLKDLNLNKDEVAETFTVPLKYFVDNDPENYDVEVVADVENFPYEETGIDPDYNWRKGINILPLYRYGERIIWGITARIAKWFAEQILVDNL